MILVDANLLLYAYNASFPDHMKAKEWLEGRLSGVEPVFLAEATILAFLRISTHPRAFESPLLAAEAVTHVREWLARPNVGVLVPGERYWDILSRLLSETRARGPLIMDAHLAALALEHGATLATTDRDFQRFPGLKTHNPLGPSPSDP